MKTVDQLLTQAEQIRIETVEYNNDSERVGAALKDTIEFMKDHYLYSGNPITLSLIYKNPVANFAALATTYPDPVKDWAAMVEDEGVIYCYNGSAWASTGLKAFPEDVLTASEQGLSEIQKEQSRSNLDITKYVIKKSNDRRYVYSFMSFDGKVLFSIDKKGKIVGDFDVKENVSVLENILSDTQQIKISKSRKYLFDITDNANRIILSVLKNGELQFPLQKVYKNVYGRKYAYSIADKNGKILLGIDKAGKIRGDFDVKDYSSDIESIFSIINNLNNLVKLVVCWGDSLTAASYPAYLQELLGDEYSVINRGVGGENSLAIAARQGGIPMYVNDITIPADTSWVSLGNYASPLIWSLWDNSPIRPLLQGGSVHINPCYIEDVECTLEWTGASYNDPSGIFRVKRNTAGGSRTTSSKSIIMTSSMKELRNANFAVFFIGQNGGFTSYVDLVNQVKKMADFLTVKNYVAITTHKSSSSEIEDAYLSEFGARYINLRHYMSAHGLADAGLNPTEADLAAMAIGNCPPQLLADGTHFTQIGYGLLANQVLLKIKELTTN